MRPYADNILNISDGVILQIVVVVTALPLFEYFDTFDSSLAVGVAFVLVILPLAQFVVMKMFTSKQTVKKIIKNALKYFDLQDGTHKDGPNSGVANDTTTNHVDLIIDDAMRRNATICEMYVSS